MSLADGAEVRRISGSASIFGCSQRIAIVAARRPSLISFERLDPSRLDVVGDKLVDPSRERIEKIDRRRIEAVNLGQPVGQVSELLVCSSCSVQVRIVAGNRPSYRAPLSVDSVLSVVRKCHKLGPISKGSDGSDRRQESGRSAVRDGRPIQPAGRSCVHSA